MFFLSYHNVYLMEFFVKLGQKMQLDENVFFSEKAHF